MARNDPPIPKNNAFQITAEFKTCPNGETFLVDDNEDASNRIIIFGAEWALDLLEGSDHWGVSFTFANLIFYF